MQDEATDTIVAVSTAPGRAAISVIRLSGRDAFEIAGRVFRRAGGEPFPGGGEERKLVLGHAAEPRTEEMIDQVLAVAMPCPHSYTGENMVEFYCHGSWIVQKSLVKALVTAGARPAEPGEYTRRAFLNGRIDLAQAEAVAGVIDARSKAALGVALRQLEGGLSDRIRTLRRRLLSVLAQLEAQIDFSDEDVGDLEIPSLVPELDRVGAELEELVFAGLEGRYLQEGIRVAIVGRPNVGKSSLLNALLMRERAIVSEIPGTTRDTIEETLEIGGMPLTLVDTAGLRATDDRLERLGVERSAAALQTADAVLIVVDLSEMPQAVGTDGHLVMKHLVPEPPEEGWDPALTIIVGNKLDLARGVRERDARRGEAGQGLSQSGSFGRLAPAGVGVSPTEDEEALREQLGSLGRSLPLSNPALSGGENESAASFRVCLVSARTSEGIDGLRESLREMVLHGRVTRPEDILLTTERQTRLARAAGESTRAASEAMARGALEELVAEDIRAAVVNLGRITGEDLVEDLLDEVFSHFCIGK